ncbi:hypothetical protein LEMLEM_LOCUS22448 [Lemmus lemmus]
MSSAFGAFYAMSPSLWKTPNLKPTAMSWLPQVFISKIYFGAIQSVFPVTSWSWMI